MQELLFTRFNGESVAYFDYGQSENVIFFHHGTPSAGPLSPIMKDNADANGFRIIEVIRPGYGSSTPISYRSVNTVSQINLDIANALGIENFAIVGGSGGGPHALASGHLAGSRCKALLIVAGLAPFDDPNFDYVAGLSEENRAAVLLSLTSLEDFEKLIFKKVKEWSSYDFDQFRELLNVDPESPISDEGVFSFQDRVKYSLFQGGRGWIDDQLAFLKPWGFPLEEISRPVQLWVGSKDVDVPPAHAEYLRRMIPDSELLIVENKNHFTISEPALEEGFKWLRGFFYSHS